MVCDGSQHDLRVTPRGNNKSKATGSEDGSSSFRAHRLPSAPAAEVRVSKFGAGRAQSDIKLHATPGFFRKFWRPYRQMRWRV